MAALTTAGEVPTEDSWSAKNQKIIVSTPQDGFLFDLKLHAKLDGSPEDVYDILADPAADKVFRGIKQVLSREVVEDDGKGKRKLRVGHRALTKFLWLSVTFDTQLYVWEDSVNRTIKFSNARNDGFMKKFEGSWSVQPFSGDSIGQAFGLQAAHHSHSWGNPFSMFHKGHSKAPSTTLVTLEQALAPRVTPPGPMQGLVRGLCGRVLQNMMADLRTELERQQAADKQAAKPEASLHRSGKRDRLPVASMTYASLDLFEAAAPLNITICL